MITPGQARAELARRELARRGVPLQEPKTDYKQVIGSAVKGIFQKPAAYAKDLGTNPESMAGAMPGLLGTVGGISPIPGGATMGTGVGQGIRDLSLKALKKPIPSGMQHVGELGLAAIGDIAAIPAMKRAHYGAEIGKAEKGAGLITRAPTKAVTPGSVGETLNNLEAQIDAGTIHTAQEARDAKAVVNQIYKNPKIYEQTGDIKVQSQRVSKKVQDLLNKMVPGRVKPARKMARAMTIPNTMRRAYQKVPWQMKLGVLGGAGEEVIRRLLGLGVPR